MFFLIVDYLIAVLLIISYPYWRKIAKGPINKYSGMRTFLSTKNRKNWERTNLLAGKYSVIFGIILFVFVAIMRHIKIFSQEINSLIIAGVSIGVLILIVFLVNRKLK